MRHWVRSRSTEPVEHPRAAGCAGSTFSADTWNPALTPTTTTTTGVAAVAACAACVLHEEVDETATTAATATAAAFDQGCGADTAAVSPRVALPPVY